MATVSLVAVRSNKTTHALLSIYNLIFIFFMAPARKRKSRPAPQPPPQTPEYAMIKDRIASFDLSCLQERRFVIDDPTSELYESIKMYGVVIYSQEDDEKYFACCCTPECFEASKMIKLGEEVVNDKKKWVSSNAVRHLDIVHGILSKNSRKKRETVENDEMERHEMKMKFSGNMTRLCELQWVKMVLLARLPFSFTTFKVVRETMHYTCIDSMNKRLSGVRVLHVATEIYFQVLSVIKMMIQDSIKAHGKKIFSVNVDGWKVKDTPRKFVGVRLYFLDPDYIMQTLLLAVREFDPSSAIRQGEGGLRTAMRVWFRGILATYGLNFDSIFGATTDGAGDVRILSQQDVRALWEWCPPHMINRVLLYVFGERNKEMMREIGSVRAVITRIRDHTKDGNLFEEILNEEDPEQEKRTMKTTQKQRFMSVFLTLSRYHEMLGTINRMCCEAKILNEVTLTKIEIEELLSMLAPLREISVKAQGQQVAYGYRILQKLIDERLNGSLNMRKPLAHFLDGHLMSTMSPRVAFTRKLLIDAIDIKFFSRYFKKKKKSDEFEQSFVMEAQLLLHPGFRNIFVVEDVVRELVNTESLALGAPWWKQKKKQFATKAKNQNVNVKNLLMKFKAECIQTTMKEVTASINLSIVDTIMEAVPEHEREEEDDGLSNQFSRASLSCANSVEQQIFNDRGEMPGFSPGPRTHSTLLSRVQTQLDAYLKAQVNSPAFRDQRLCVNVPLWLKTVGIFKYGLVVKAFAAFWSVPTSSSGIELDFYFNSLLLRKQRTSIRGEVAEMVHMVDRNQALIDLPQVRFIFIIYLLFVLFNTQIKKAFFLGE